MNWQDLIVSFFEKKVSVSKLYTARKFIEDKEKEIEKEKSEQKKNKLIEKRDNKIQELITLRQNAPKDEIKEWLSTISKKKIKQGKRIIKATHVLRFSHSSSEAEGFLCESKDTSGLLTTASFKGELKYDLAHNNGSLITISRFLALKLNGKMLIDLILENQFEFLNGFYNTQEELDEWKIGLSNLVEKREISTADKAKQIYFPLEDKGLDKYHLLVPLFSSTLAEELYLFQSKIVFDEVQSKIRKAFAGNGGVSFYNKDFLVTLPNLAVQKFGGAQPQNVSMLNKSRSWKADKKDRSSWGVTYLLNSAPPFWKTNFQIQKYKSFFDSYEIYRSAKEDVDYLKDFLLCVQNLGLSIKDPKRYKWVEESVENIIEKILFYAASIQKNLAPGWSATENIRLKKAHQHFLDPHRMDDTYQAERQSTDWQTKICKDFSSWLNRQLRGKDKKFTPQKEHQRLWAKLMETPLREHCKTMELL